MADKRVLVLETHSDDSAIGAHGLIRTLSRKGFTPYFAVMAVSDVDFLHCGRVTSNQRKAEYAAYVERMGGIWVRNLLPLDAESRLDAVERRRLVRILESMLAEIRPHIVICQAPSFHHDHTITYEAAMAAMRPTVRWCPDEVLLMENPTYVHSLGPATDFKPTTYCALSEEDMADKLSCFTECFPTQVRDRENCLSPDGIRAWARYRGIECRADYAEAFMTFMRRIT